MRKFLTAVLFALAFISIAGITSASAQVHPQLLEGKDVFKLEDDATERWKAALPRLNKNMNDYHDAWQRMKKRVTASRSRWFDIDESSPIGRKKEEMWQWCLSGQTASLPVLADKTAAERFARLEVRATLCEETSVPSKDAQAKK